MTSLLDTSVVVGDGLESDAAIGDSWSISVVTVGELEAGVLLAGRKAIRAARLRRLSAVLAVAPTRRDMIGPWHLQAVVDGARLAAPVVGSLTRTVGSPTGL